MEHKYAIALAGNPNVGKSTLFNALTGMRQHTGNWPGKTVSAAEGSFIYNNCEYSITDLPGCYSLLPHSAEEEAARDHICSGKPDLVVVVADATCLERNLNLLLQAMEITPNVLLCVNLMDEAKKKCITLDLIRISARLGIPVISTTARSKNSHKAVLPHIEAAVKRENFHAKLPVYPAFIQNGIDTLTPLLPETPGISRRYRALRLLDGTASRQWLPGLSDKAFAEAENIRRGLFEEGITPEEISDCIATALLDCAKEICRDTVSQPSCAFCRDRRIDRILTGKVTGFPIMLLLLAGIFFLTITGANYPSALLSDVLFRFQDVLMKFCISIDIPPYIYEPLVFGVYRVLAWVVSVMLPPMAIFFPLFTLLEDLGYLPRIAFNLDRCFKGCSACGKQALTMCMGFGCNAVGVTGCRIIDSPRERLIAIITNSLVPCNGRFPTLIAVITMFFAGGSSTLLGTLILTAVIVFGVLLTLLSSLILSKTLLKGVSSAFTLELPPYRMPQYGQVIVRSVLDRTAFVLGRAVAVAAPAGLVIWLMANLTVNGSTVLSHCASFLDPLGKLMGLDGIILMAFILGFPANEIVVPIMLMAYMSTGILTDFSSLAQLKDLLVQNGWSWTTAVSMLIFSLAHWPCSTTCLTIKKETQSLKWTLVSVLLPTFLGMVLCILFNLCANLLMPL